MIEVHDLSFTYAGAEHPAVRDLTFRVEPGEIFGFLGPSGAGKSTTQKILTGLLTDFHGRARVFDQDLAAYGGDYYERIGVSSEFPNHYQKLTGAENLRYFASLYRNPSPPPETLLEAVGLSDSADRPVMHYSKGMKTRLGLARAIQHECEHLDGKTFIDGLSGLKRDLLKRKIKKRIKAGDWVSANAPLCS